MAGSLKESELVPAVVQALLQLSQSQLATLKSEMKTCQVGPGDVLYVPMGMLLFEAVSDASSVCWGVRVPIITRLKGELLESAKALHQCFLHKGPEAVPALTMALKMSE